METFVIKNDRGKLTCKPHLFSLSRGCPIDSNECFNCLQFSGSVRWCDVVEQAAGEQDDKTKLVQFLREG